MAKGIINEEFLQQVETLQTLLQNNISGLFGGNRQSKTYGSSCEFADYRDYIPGDDITKIDWNAYARFEKLYQKLYLDERQMHTRIYIDVSRSMAYGKSKKAEQALRLACTFAYLSLHEMDKVSIYTVRDNQLTEVISGMVGKDAFIQQIQKLNEIEFGGDIHFADAIIPSKVGMGDGMSVIISDFLTENDYEGAIRHLAEKKRDVLCMQVLSAEELNPKTRGKVHFFDSEDVSKTYRKNIDKTIIQAYRQALEYATGRVRDYCYACGAKYWLVSEEDSMVKIFFENLVNAGVIK